MLLVLVRIVCLSAVILLSGCGLKGPLTLPPQPDQAALQDAPPVPADTTEVPAVLAVPSH